MANFSPLSNTIALEFADATAPDAPVIESVTRDGDDAVLFITLPRTDAGGRVPQTGLKRLVVPYAVALDDPFVGANADLLLASGAQFIDVPITPEQAGQTIVVRRKMTGVVGHVDYVAACSD